MSEKSRQGIQVDFADDIRQSFVVMRNEITKFMRGKKMLIYAALTAVLLAIVTVALVFFSEGGLGGLKGHQIGENYTMLCIMMVMIAVTLFSSTSIVSEFEERTALILFTKPIRKRSIYFGKLLASSVVIVGFVAMYYLFVAALCLVGPGEVPADLWTSFAIAVMYAFATTGVAFLISSVMKKSSTSAIMTFFILALLLDVLVTVVLLIVNGNINKDDSWFMINSAGNDLMLVFSKSVDALRDCAVLFVWGIVSMIGGYVLFKRRDF